MWWPARPADAAETGRPALDRLLPGDRPIARFEVTAGGDPALAPLLARVIEAGRTTDPFDPEDDERVLRRLRDTAIDVLATEGYFTPAVTVETNETDPRSRYVLNVDPGPRTQVTAVDIKLTGAIEAQAERMRELLAGWELPIGQPFRDAAWRVARARLLTKVQERDFPTARLLDAAAEINADAATARLHIAIDSGPAFTLGELQIVEGNGLGLKRFDRDLVERFNDIQPGEPYDATRLLDLQRRLQSGPFFSSVLVDVPLDPAAPERVPIRLSLVEGKSKRLSTGVGYSTNTGFQVEGLYRQVGLFGFPYTLQAGAGYDRTRTVGYADILLPPKPSGARDSLGVLAERTDIQNEITERYAAGVERLHQRESAERAGGVNYVNRTAIKLQRETTEQRGDPTSRFTNDTLTLSNTWTWRRVDSLTNPTRGDVISLTGAVGVSRSGLSDLLAESFVHGYGRYVRYIPVFNRHQIILRGEIGHVVTDDLRFVPSDYRFRTGGAGSVRGYDYQSLGVTDGAAVTGADTLLVGSAEYVHWFTTTWGGAAFYDVGDADNDLANVRLARGYGAGVRYRTIAGPLGLDVAYGERDRQWRVHFSIAVAF
ncbi:MAG: BamA/TamA family outer membrane protein [Burkholderiaceae bacterium]|nr:BamA/TamA family outer membrane protein [Burkholderiaceae bacterium]